MAAKNTIQEGEPLKPSLFAEAIETLYYAGQPGMFWASPGVGKSAILASVVKKIGATKKWPGGFRMIDMRLVIRDAVDLRGIPFVVDGKTYWAVPNELPSEGYGILFLDEINAAHPTVQAAAYQLVLDRQLGEYKLPDGWVVMAAGNREGDGAVVFKMPSALRNRFVHLDLETDEADWVKWALGAGIQPEIIGFIHMRPDLLNAFDKNARTFPTPRAWEFVNKIMLSKPSQAIEHALFCGAVGVGAAVEFSAFLRSYRSLPDIAGILAKPKTAPVPTEPSVLYAVAAALSRKAEVGNLGAIISYLERCPIEFNVMAINDAIHRDKRLQTVAEFTKWAVTHKDVFI